MSEEDVPKEVGDLLESLPLKSFPLKKRGLFEDGLVGHEIIDEPGLEDFADPTLDDVDEVLSVKDEVTDAFENGIGAAGQWYSYKSCRENVSREKGRSGNQIHISFTLLASTREHWTLRE